MIFDANYMQTIIPMMLFLSLIPVSIYDAKCRIIPNKYNYGLFAVGIVYLGILTYNGIDIRANVIIGIMVAIVAILIGVISKGGLGGGDIKLLIPASFIIGAEFQTIILLTCILEIVFYIILRSLKRESQGILQDSLPMCPFFMVALGVFLIIKYLSILY